MNEELFKTSVMIPRALHIAARVKALEQRITFTEVVRRFLERWGAGEIELDSGPTMWRGGPGEDGRDFRR